MRSVRTGVVALLLSVVSGLIAPVAGADTVPVPAPLPSVPAGGQIPPPGPHGCLCRCPGSPVTSADKWFCGDPCEAVAEEVTLAELEAWVAANCFPMQHGANPLGCVSCLSQTVEYMKRYCECKGDFTCDRNGDSVVDCADLRDFLDFDRGTCISREQMRELVAASCSTSRHRRRRAAAEPPLRAVAGRSRRAFSPASTSRATIRRLQSIPCSIPRLRLRRSTAS